MIRALANETHKNLLLIWSYRINLILWIIFDITMMTGIMLLFGDGSDTERMESRASYLLGFLVTALASSAISTMNWGLREEMQVGTLEQMSMSPHSLNLLLIGRLAADMLISIIFRILVGGGIILAMNLSLPMRIEMLPVLMLIFIGIYGFGFMIGGMALVFKRTDAIAGVLTNLLMWVNGTFVAVSYYPAWLEFVAKTLPVTQGIIVLRGLMFRDTSLSAAWSDGTLFWLTIHSTVLFVIGVLIFQWCERIAKNKGSLSQY